MHGKERGRRGRRDERTERRVMEKESGRRERGMDGGRRKGMEKEGIGKNDEHTKLERYRPKSHMIYTLQHPAKHLIKNDITSIVKFDVANSKASSNEHTDIWKIYV